VAQFEIRRRRWLTPAWGCRFDNPRIVLEKNKPCKGSSRGEPLQGFQLIGVISPGFSLRSNPGLKLANAFGVFQIEPAPYFQTDPHLLAVIHGARDLRSGLKLANAFGVFQIEPAPYFQTDPLPRRCYSRRARSAILIEQMFVRGKDHNRLQDLPRMRRSLDLVQRPSFLHSV